MIITDIKIPIIKILSDNDMRKVDRDSFNLCDNGWFRVGGMVKIRHEWTQTLIREGRLREASVENESMNDIMDGLKRKPGRPKGSSIGDKALKTITEG